MPVEHGSGFVLTKRQEQEAKAAAYEGALFYSFVKSRVEAGGNIAIIGNRRYGHDFVVEPLRPHLEALNVVVASAVVNSSSTLPWSVANNNVLPEFVGKRFDIVVVDGTTLPYLSPGKLRLPRSMIVYLNWIIAYNQAAGMGTGGIPEHHEANLTGRIEFERAVEAMRVNHPDTHYVIRHWSPMDVTEVTFGGMLTQQYAHPNRADNLQIIFACPTVFPGALSSFPEEFKDHEPAFFDYLELDGNGKNDPRVPLFQEEVGPYFQTMLQ